MVLPANQRSLLPPATNPSCYLQALFGKATAPFKNMLMLAFMMWMSGSQLHLFSIMTTLSGVYQPLSAILKSGEGG